MYILFIIDTVVIWSDMLGDLHSGQDSLSWSRPQNSSPDAEKRELFGIS